MLSPKFLYSFQKPLWWAITYWFPFPRAQNFGGKNWKTQEAQKVFRCTFSPFLSSFFFFFFLVRFPSPLPPCWKARGKRTWHPFCHVDSSGPLKHSDPWKARIPAYPHSSLSWPWCEVGKAGCRCGGWACWITPEPQLCLPLSVGQPAFPSLFLPATCPRPSATEFIKCWRSQTSEPIIANILQLHSDCRLGFFGARRTMAPGSNSPHKRGANG